MALSPYRVLDLTDERGQFAGALLAQLGAEVILVEPPGGNRARALAPFIDDQPGPDRSLFHWSYNRGKRSVVVEGAEQLAELAATADVLIECGAAGLEVDLAALRAVNPSLITASITPFGDDGPKAGWLATDLTLAAAGGVLSVTGDKDRPPVRISHPQSWLNGSADAVSAISIALYERARSGLGQHIDVSTQQSLIAATQFSMMNALVGAPPAKRIAGGLEMGQFAMRFVYPCADGHVNVTYLFGSVIGPYTNRLFAWIQEAGFCDGDLGQKNWITYATDVLEGRQPIEDLARAAQAIEAFTLSMTQQQLVEQSMARGALIAPIHTSRDILDLPHLAERGFWRELAVPGRVQPARLTGPFVRMHGSPSPPLGPPPALGEHSAALWAEPRRAPQAPAPSSTGEPAALAEEPTVPSADGTRGPRPLDGLKVVDLFWALAGPGSTRTLADFGATVIRIESEKRPELLRAASPFRSEGVEFEGSMQFHSTNAGKLHLQLNLANPHSRDVLFDLVRWADVLTESFTPRAMRGLGLSYEVIKAVNPDIIMVSSCLMGQDGSLRDYAGFGTAGAAFAGFYPITGWPDRLPAGPYTAYTDYISPRFTVAAILAAVEHRRRTGQGQYLDVSQMEIGLQLLAPVLLDDELHGRTATRRGNADPHLAPHAVLPVGDPADDRWIAIVCETDEQWTVLAGMASLDVALAELSSAERIERAGALEVMLADWTAGQDPIELQERLQAAGVAAHQVQNSPECVADPQLVLRHQFREVPHPIYGTTFVEGPAFRLSRTPGGPRWAGPPMGTHTHQVLSELLGYDDDRITELVIAGALE